MDNVTAPVRLVDVFVGKGARGNTAAVVILDAIQDSEALQRRACEIGAPATAFVVAAPQDEAHQVRWYSPKREIALCGHGAIAAAHVLLAGRPEGTVRFQPHLDRTATVQTGEEHLHYELGMGAMPLETREWSELAKALCVAPKEVLWAAGGYACVILHEADQVAALAPDGEALAALGNLQISVSAAGSLEGRVADITSRVFSEGGVEDAATGSAHAVLASYWSERLGKSNFVAHQASSRGGILGCRVESGRVWIGGAVREA